MLTIIAEVIIAFFISNYESEKHPYQMSLIKGFLLAFAGFFLAMAQGYFRNSKLSFSQMLLFLVLSLGIGLITSIFFMICAWLDLQVKNKP